MKFIWCQECGDKVQLPVQEEPRYCLCGKSWGRYIPPYKEREYEKDGETHTIREYEDVLLGGAAIPFGIGTGLFLAAEEGRSFVFVGWFYNNQTIDTEHIHYEGE